MKKLKIEILEKYKAYEKDACYELEGDLIVLSGINGSGKSQLLQIIAQNSHEKINRRITQIFDDGTIRPLNNVILLSFRDNINLGSDFGKYEIMLRQQTIAQAWEFYHTRIRFNNISASNRSKKEKYNRDKNLFIYNDDGIKNSAWRSIIKLMDLLDSHYNDDQKFNLTQQDIEQMLPNDFIWRNENDIIQQVGNIFYQACCKRVNEQLKFSCTSEIFNNDLWLKNAPWTILNQLFQDLGFKYRFKDDYEFNTPNMDENPKLREHNDIRGLSDLSDGEKAILKLALVSLDEEVSKDLSLVLFDEYEAPLNPSLTEAFYHVIEKFYLNKGIQVILTTHSPATISLAPDYTRFYECFSQTSTSPKILEVSQYDYEELKVANRYFYAKIRNQTERIKELEKSPSFLGNILCVEDEYDEIYKIAYLKIKEIKDITEENFEEKFNDISNFKIYGGFSTGGLVNLLLCNNTSIDKSTKTICLFDFDNEGYKKFKDLSNKKDNKNKLFLPKEGLINTGIYIKHSKSMRYALMLPIPHRLEKFVSTKSSSDCFIEVETLISEDFLKANNKAEQRSEALPFYKVKDEHKKNFWKDLLSADNSYFDDFKPLFSQIETLFIND